MTLNPKSSVQVMDVLARCGWVSHPHSCSDEPALKYNFGNFELSAGTFTNFYLQRSVTFEGLYDDHRTLEQILFQAPEWLVSRAQVLAWVAHGLRETPVVITPDWLEEGRQCQDLLPWELERAAYKLRPEATVAREWMRILGKHLKAEAESSAGVDTCSVHFDGTSLRFTFWNRTLVVQASGNAPWSVDVILALSRLQWLPKRWSQDPVIVSYWDGHINIGNRRFAATIAPRSAD